MKYINLESFAGILLIFLFSLLGCKREFLDVKPSGILLDEQMISPVGVREALIGAYSSLDGQYDENSLFPESEANAWVTGSINGGDAHKGSFASDGGQGIQQVARLEGQPSDNFFNIKWISLYDGISRSNLVMRLASRVSGMDQMELDNIVAQARFLRGYFSLTAKLTWNNIPWVDTSVVYSAGNYQVPNDQDVFPFIEDDLKFAYENLPEFQEEIGRANKWAAGSILAKAYMFQNKFDLALPLLEEIIDKGVTPSGVKYGLNPRFSMNFDFAYNNSQESIFAIQASLNDGAKSFHGNIFDLVNYPSGPGSVTGCCGFYQPSIELVNSYRTDNDGLPLLNGTLTNPDFDLPANAIKTDMGVPSSVPFTPDAGPLDPRLDWTVGRRGIPYLDWGIHPGMDWMKDQASAGPYSPKKNVFNKAQIGTGGDNSLTQWAPTNAINYNIIRYAQILLWAAECEVEIGDLDDAQKYVNQIRSRASNPQDFVSKNGTPAANYVVSEYPLNWFANRGQDYAREAVHFEQKLEFAMEGHRFYDLVRWGDADDAINFYFQYENKFTTELTGASFVNPTNNYYPIPQTQIDLSNNTLKQNPGYH